AVGQWPVMQPLPCRVQADGVVVAFADVQPQEHAITAGHPPRPSFVSGGRRSSIDGRHPRYDETYPKAAVSLFNGPSMPAGLATPPPPDHALDWGHQSYRTWRPQLLDQEPRKR